MDRARYLALRALHSTQRWLRARWTPAGRLALAALASSAVLGLDTRESASYQLFTFLLPVLLFSFAASLGRGPRPAVSRALPRFGTAGEPLPYRVLVKNTGRASLRGLEAQERLADPAPSYAEFLAARVPPGAGVVETFSGWARWRALVRRRTAGGAEGGALPDLPPGGSAECAARLLPARRGVIRLEALAVSAADPLGLARRAAEIASPASVVVLPRRYPVSNLNLPGGRKYQQGGVALASSVGESMEFSTLRDYRPGDPPRRIHWRSYARTGRLIVKENHDEYFVRHALALDTFVPPGGEAAFEEAVSVAASFACTVLTQESLLDLLFVGSEAYSFTVGRGLGGPERVLEILAAVQPCEARPFAEFARSLALRHRLMSGCLLVLLDWDDERRALVRRLRAMGVPLQPFLVRGAAGALPEPADGVRLLEPGRVAEGLAKL